MVVSRSLTNAPSYSDLTLGDAELEEVKGLRLLGVALDFKLRFKTRLYKVVLKAARSLSVVCQAGKLFDFLRVRKSCFNAHVLYNLEHCALGFMSSAEYHLGLQDNVVRRAERLCEGELCCLGHRRKISALCLLYKVYHRADHSMHEYLHHFVSAHNARAPAAVCEFALGIRRCRTD